MDVLVEQKFNKAEELISLFNELFLKSYNTILDHTQGDPLYLPADSHNPHNRILFANRFATSAQHEISHWCIAGKTRLQQVDYGYWYQPDGRSPLQQEAFLKFEAKNQGLEWLFSLACKVDFHISTDNLECCFEDRVTQNRDFAQRVLFSARNFLNQGLPPRADIFLEGCLRYFNSKTSFDMEIINLKMQDSLPNH